MRVLIVYCHPNRDSFSGAVLDSLKNGCIEGGHTIDIVDLHAEDFDPRFTKADFHLFRTGEGLTDDLGRYQKLMDEAEALILVYPIWWFGMPAMLKGWFDRVFSNGWMFHFEVTEGPELKHHLVNRPVLAEKKIIQLCPAGLSRSTYKKYNYAAALNRLIDVGIFEYCGAEDIASYLLPDIDEDPDARAEHLTFAYSIGKTLKADQATAQLRI